MAFGEQDTMRLCNQYREATQREAGQYAALAARLAQAVQLIAGVQSIPDLTDDRIAWLARQLEGRRAEPKGEGRTSADPR